MPYAVSRWTRPECYSGAEFHKYYTSGVGMHSASDCLAESNFYTMLNALGGPSETVVVIKEHHWLVECVEWIAIHESDEHSLNIARKLCDDLNQYPILDEDDFANREEVAAESKWWNMSVKERIDYIRKNRSQFEFADYRDLLGCVRGKYFCGYASELLYG